MSAEKLIQTMEKLLKLHKSLYELALKKTDIVKNNDIDPLNQILKDEQAHLAAINNLEKDRQKISLAMVPRAEKPTIGDCLKAMDGSQRATLAGLRSELLNVISELKTRNDLNQQMIYQSLRFVNFSLSLMRPKLDHFNYGPQVGKTHRPEQAADLFNLKA